MGDFFDALQRRSPAIIGSRILGPRKCASPAGTNTGDMRLFLVTILVALIGSPQACPTSPDDNQHQGAIFGKVQPVKGLPDSRVHAPAAVRIEGTAHAVLTDSEGMFVFDRVPEGSYVVLASLDALSGRVHGLVVSGDSASIVTVLIEESGTGFDSDWMGVTLGRKDLYRKGSIAGRVTPSGLRLLPCGTANVRLDRTFWHTRTDSTGLFRFRDVLPGIYTVTATHTCYKPHGPIRGIRVSYLQSVVGVRVLDNRTSIVEPRLCPTEAPYPCSLVYWVENYEEEDNS